jgi:hypothetical protein
MADLKDRHFMQPSINPDLVDEELRVRFMKYSRYLIPNNADGKAAACLIKEQYGIVHLRRYASVVEITCKEVIDEDQLSTLEALRL